MTDPAGRDEGVTFQGSRSLVCLVQPPRPCAIDMVLPLLCQQAVTNGKGGANRLICSF